MKKTLAIVLAASALALASLVSATEAVPNKPTAHSVKMYLRVGKTDIPVEKINPGSTIPLRRPFLAPDIVCVSKGKLIQISVVNLPTAWTYSTVGHADVSDIQGLFAMKRGSVRKYHLRPGMAAVRLVKNH